MADLIARLDEGAADIMRAYDSKLERNAACLLIADGGSGARIRHGNDYIRLDRAFDGKLFADALADRIDRGAVDDRIGPREIDMLEDAGAGTNRRERPDRADAPLRHDHQLARFDRAPEGCADHLQPARFRRVDVDLGDGKSTRLTSSQQR